MANPAVENLTIDIDARGEHLLVTVAGEVDTASSGRLELELLGAVEDVDRDVDLDLSGISFLDSSGLRTLVMAQQAVAGQGRQVRLVGSTSMIDRLFEITGLSALFPGA